MLLQIPKHKHKTMTFTSKAFLLVAVLAAAYPPPSRGEETTVILDPKNGNGNGIIDNPNSIDIDNDNDDLAILTSQTQLLSSPIDFLQNNPPNLILASTFPTPKLHNEFEQWKSKFNRTSSSYKTLHEHAYRKLIWLQNHAHIETHNNYSPSYSHSLAHNDFSDLTNDEFRKRFYLGEYSPGVVEPKGLSDGSSSWSLTATTTGSDGTSTSRKLLRSDVVEDGNSFQGTNEEEYDNNAELNAMDNNEDDEATVVNVPEFKNWVKEGAVTKVKNQWFCGACWAFSAVGAIEGARYIKSGNLTELSMQQLLDCDMTDLGCGGGLMDQAFQYDSADSVGLCALNDYPFAYHRHWFYGCSRYMPYCEPLPNTKVIKYVNVTKTEEALKAAIATQPISVAVSAGPMDWQFYSKGVFNKGCDAQIDHGVLAVGYGHYDPTTDPAATAGSVGGDYWLIKNSWGEYWGLNGYIQLGRGGGNEAEGGTSCVLTLASRPIMKVED